MKTITLTSRISLRDDLHTVDVNDATIIANASAGDYYGVELIARRIWELIPRSTTVAELCEALMKEYDVDRATCEREVVEFLNESVREGLILTDNTDN